MATNKFKANAKAVAQVTTLTVGGTFALGQVYSVTCNTKIVSYTANGSDATNNDVASGLQATLAVAGIAEFGDAQFTNATNVVTCTATVAGVPFTFTSGATGTGTLTAATPTASKGPRHYDDTNNWSLTALPANGDDVIIERLNGSISFGLNQSAVNLNSLKIPATYTGQIGLPEFNSQYAEYRLTYLAISTALLEIGAGDGGGSTRIQIDLGTNVCAARIYKTGGSSLAGQPALFLKGVNAGNSVNITGGSVGLAFELGSVSTFPTVNCGYTNSPPTDVTLYLGVGLTMTTLNMSGGTVLSQCAITTVNMEDGQLTHLGTASITTVNGQKGRLFYQSSGTITTLTCGTDFTADFRRDLRARTVTNCTMVKDSALYDSFKTCTFTNNINLKDCGLSEVKLDLGSNFGINRF